MALAVSGAEPFIPEPPPAPEKQKPADQIIDASEMDRLRGELREMKEQNAKLLQKIDDLVDALAKAQSGKAGDVNPGQNAAAKGALAAAAAAPAHRNWSRIEIGMTRADVDRFINTNRKLKIISVSANSGVTGQQEETVVRREGNVGSTVVRRGGRTDSRDLGPGAVADSQQAINEQQREVIERRTSRGKTEIITVAQLGSYRVQNGSERNAFGGSVPTYGTALREVGRLRIVLTDDVVTAIEGTQR